MRAAPARRTVVLLLPRFQRVLPSQGMFPRSSWGLLKVARGTSEALCTPSCFNGLFAAHISPSTRISNPPSSWHPSTSLHPSHAALRPRMTTARSPAPRARAQWFARLLWLPRCPSRAGSGLVQWKAPAAGAGLGAGWETKALWEGAGLFSVLNTIQVPSPLQTKGLQCELSVEIQPQGGRENLAWLNSMCRHFTCHFLEGGGGLHNPRSAPCWFFRGKTTCKKPPAICLS